MVLLTVPDEAIEDAARAVPRGPVVLHCSGATPLDPVAHHVGHGSLHPLMTFPGPEVALPDLRGVPAAVDGDRAGLAAAQALAADLGLHAVRVPGDRALYHGAAVLAGNGATVLLAEGCRALAAAGVPEDLAPSLLIPLMLASIRNAGSGPRQALTGPVARGDQAVLRAHQQALTGAGLQDTAALHAALARSAENLLRGPHATGPDADTPAENDASTEVSDTE